MVYDARPDPITEDNDFNRAVLGGKKDKRINMPMLFDPTRQVQLWMHLRQICDEAIMQLRGAAGAEPLPMRSRLLITSGLIGQFNSTAKEIKAAYETELREVQDKVTNIRDRAS